MASQTNVGCEICGSLLHDYERHQEMNQSSRGFGRNGSVSKCNARKRRVKDIKKLKDEMIEIGKELIKVVPKFQKELIKRYGD